MLVKKPFYQKNTFWRWAFVIGLVLIYCLLFWDDVISIILRGIWVLIFGYPELVPNDYIDPIVYLPQAIENVLKFAIVFSIFLPLSILFASQFILPVQTWSERKKVYDRLSRYAFGQHGPAIFIRNGKQIARPEELKRPYPGVVFVDMNSAVLLERISKPAAPTKPDRTLMDILTGHQPKYRTPRVARVEGPGIAFISGKERIRGVADLRRQVRANTGPMGEDGKPEGVRAYTRDGIEVSSAAISAVFTLGQQPDVLDVAYVDGNKPENLRVLTIATKLVKDETIPGRWHKVKYIKGISQDNDAKDMDIEDKREIHGFSQDRLHLEHILDELEKRSLGEEKLLNFVRQLGIKNEGPVEWLINNLYTNNKQAYRTFINRLKPADTETMHRFVINKSVIHQLVREIAGASNAKQVGEFIEQLFTTYREQVLEFYYGLDDTTRDIINRFTQRFYTEQQISPSFKPPRKIGSSPFYFDERRVFAALYANARNPQENSVDDWTKLSPQIATEFYRSIIARYKFDELFKLENSDTPLAQEEAKPMLKRALCYQGVLAYHLLRRKDDKYPQVGDELSNADYILDHPILELRNPKVLRDRGIKVIASGFSALRLSKDIQQQRIDNWLARWEVEAQRTMTDDEIEIMRIRGQARANAQRELIQDLSNIFSQPYTKEAMAVRIFQTLEAAAADPQTRRLLPMDTLSFIQNLRSWLLDNSRISHPAPQPEQDDLPPLPPE